VTEWDPVPGSNYYGVVVDQQDRVWVNGLSKKTLVMWDPKTEAWKKFLAPNNARRPSIDASGHVWFSEYFGNAVTMLDPGTGRFTRYPLPLPYGNPYEGYIDKDGSFWTDASEYNSLVRFDSRTRRFTYYPFPDAQSHTPKVETDAEGTVWFGYRSSLFAFKQNGNAAPLSTRVAQQRTVGLR
jgi:streptogramin lyase